MRKTFYNEILELDKQKVEIQKEITLEERTKVLLTEPQIRFFLTSLKNGNANDIKYRKVLISTFINAIYLYDDKVSFIFNSGDKSITINDKLLSDMEVNNTEAEGLFINKVALPKEDYSIDTNTMVFLFCQFIFAEGLEQGVKKTVRRTVFSPPRL